MIKKLLLCFSLLFVLSNYSQENENKKSKSSFAKEISFEVMKICAKTYATALGASIMTVYAHEYGHALAMQLLYKNSGQIIVNHHWNPILISGSTHYLPNVGARDSTKDMLVSLAGPVAGLAACYAMLKLSTFLNCYLEKRKKMKPVKLTENPDSKKAVILKEGWNIASALRKTWTGGFVNHHQSFEFQAGVIFVSMGQICCSLLPGPSNDGDSIAQYFLGKSVYKQSPDFWNKAQQYLFLFGWIGTVGGWASFTHFYKLLRLDVKPYIELHKAKYLEKLLDQDKKIEDLTEKIANLQEAKKLK